MKLATCVVSLVCATLAFGQSSLQVQSPSGPVRLSAASILGVAADKERALLEHLKAAVLRQQLTHLERTYPAEHPRLQQMQSEIKRMEDVALVSDISAASRESDKGIVQLKGNVEIRTDTMTLTADEADYSTGTGEIEARGNVRVKLTPK